MSDRYHEALAWAREELPDEYAPFAASASLSLQMLGREVTPDAVRERLKAQGRDKDSIAARDERYAEAA